MRGWLSIERYAIGVPCGLASGWSPWGLPCWARPSWSSWPARAETTPGDTTAGAPGGAPAVVYVTALSGRMPIFTQMDPAYP
jgi:hypothetical protein